MCSDPTREVRPDPARWLETRLGGGYDLQPASADASFRSYLRATRADDTLILMDAPPGHEECRPFVQVAAMLRAAGVHAPAVLDADLAHGYLLLEDLGDLTYLRALDRGADPEPLYADALAALVRMQCIGPDAGDLPSYDGPMLRSELSLFPDWYLKRHRGVAVPDWLTGVEDVLVANALAQPQVFVHRDYHSRNLMVVGDGNPGVLDFQDAVRGPVSYDLVSLLRDAYVAWPEERVERWIADYRRMAVAAGIDCGPDGATFRRWFDLTGLQRQLKVAGIFARLNHRDGKARYLADIPRTLGYARAAARRYPELGVLAAWLADLPE